MQLWTILIATALSGPFDGQIIAYSVYPSHAICVEAGKVISATLAGDYKSECQVTTAPSVSPWPKERKLP